MNDSNFNYYGYACWFFKNNYNKGDIDEKELTKLYRFQNGNLINDITWQKKTHINAFYNLFSPFLGNKFEVGVDFKQKKMYVQFPRWKKVNINKLNEKLPFVEITNLINKTLKSIIIIDFSKIYFYNNYYFNMQDNKNAKQISLFDIQSLDKIGKLPQLPKIETDKDKLNSLIGLTRAKEQINKIISLSNINKIRKERGFNIDENFSKHMLFIGNPGTGKTTVATLISHILYNEKIIKKEDPTIVSARDLLKSDGYSGTIERNFEKIIRQSIGGILFIDEAYSLIPSNKDDGNWNTPGKSILSMLLSYMEKYRDNLIVIMAGYQKEINNMLKSNPGLKSRFTNEIIFDDFSKDEMYKILLDLINKNNIVKIKDEEYLKAAFFDFLSIHSINGNGRGVRNIYEQLCMNQALRVSEIKNPTNEQLLELSNVDIKNTFER